MQRINCAYAPYWNISRTCATLVTSNSTQGYLRGGMTFGIIIYKHFKTNYIMLEIN